MAKSKIKQSGEVERKKQTGINRKNSANEYTILDTENSPANKQNEIARNTQTTKNIYSNKNEYKVDD